ncbi:MAG: cupin domain-containing protein [Mycobacteriaceae bacterium]|nr:cupin domain-containing protein [Mycobacteriaceae bacterium]
MPVIRNADAQVFSMHGVRFNSFARPDSGSAEMCQWRVDIPGANPGVAHRIKREELFMVAAGRPVLTIDGEVHELFPGDVAVANANSTIQLDNPGSDPASVWVTAPVGFEGELADGTVIRPPWVQ